MVRTTKNMLRKMIGRAMLTIFELDTIVKEISAAINDRPITFVSDGLDEPSPLTPNHLIYGRRLKSNPEKTTIEDEPPLATRDELILSEKRLTDSLSISALSISGRDGLRSTFRTWTSFTHRGNRSGSRRWER